MLRHMVFCRFLCVVDSVEMMSVSQVSVMGCLLMRSGLVMLGRFKMMACGMLMVLGRLLVVLCTFVFSHVLLLLATALCALAFLLDQYLTAEIPGPEIQFLIEGK
jgi:hypothetical protein